MCLNLIQSNRRSDISDASSNKVSKRTILWLAQYFSLITMRRLGWQNKIDFDLKPVVRSYVSHLENLGRTTVRDDLQDCRTLDLLKLREKKKIVMTRSQINIGQIMSKLIQKLIFYNWITPNVSNCLWLLKYFCRGKQFQKDYI